MRNTESAPDGWVPYRSRGGRLVGHLVRSARSFESPELPRTRRRLVAWLPPSVVERGAACPVLYLQDGHNMFDEGASFAGSWDVDATLADLAADGLEAVAVAIPNAGPDRLHEYSPFLRQGIGGRATAYLDFVCDAVKPFVEDTLPVRSDRASTGLVGSSMGGNLALFGFFDRPDIFGLAAAMSPALWFGAAEWASFIASWTHVGGRIYLDVGGREAPEDDALNQAYLAGYQLAADRLEAIGYQRDELRAVLAPEGDHSEASWRSRAPAALRFLLDGV